MNDFISYKYPAACGMGFLFFCEVFYSINSINLSMDQEFKLKLTKYFLYLSGGIILIYVFFSHWFFADFYHYTLFGFETYNDSQVKIIGTLSLIPALMLFFSAVDPIKNVDSIKLLIASGFMISFTYTYLILFQSFPVLEYFNIILYVSLSLILIVIYPWDYKPRKTKHKQKRRKSIK